MASATAKKSAVKVTKKFRKNIELEVFQQTVGHPYLIQLVSFFQNKVLCSFFNTFKPTPEQGSVSSNLLCGPCPSAARAYIFVYVLQCRRLAPRVWVAWKCSMNSPLFGAVICGLFFALFRKTKNRSQSCVCSMICGLVTLSAVRAVGV